MADSVPPGDNVASATRVGRVLGISQVHAGLSPQQKMDAVQAARASAQPSSQHMGVIMVSRAC